MPTYSFECEVCGHEGREWRPEGYPPRFCSKKCKYRGWSRERPKQQKWPITPAIHEHIKQVYARMTGNGEVAELAARLGYPRWKITKYAREQGWLAKQPKMPDWRSEELRILERNAHFSPDNIRRKLKTAGFNRSVAGIVLKRKRLRLAANLGGMSAYALAECFGVDAHFVTRAIAQGRLAATMRKSRRTERQGGDIYFIRDKDIRTYIVDNIHEIDIRKVDKYWFVDVLAMDIPT